MTNGEEPKFIVSQRTLVIIIIAFVFLIFASIVGRAIISGHP